MHYTHDRNERQRNPGQINTRNLPYQNDMGLDRFDLMRDYLSARGLNCILALHNGWYPVENKGLRIYIPAVTRIPGHMYWQARSIEGHPLRYDSPFGPRRDALVVVKGEVPCSTVCIVEGPMDALAMAELTGVAGIALLGLSPPEEALAHLASLCEEYSRVVCVPDKAEIDGMMLIQNYLANRAIQSTMKIPFDRKDIADYNLRDRRLVLDD